jgi:hypothetical protein
MLGLQLSYTTELPLGSDISKRDKESKMGAETKLLQSRPNSTQARKGMRRGHPELAVECPQCHSPIGRTCFMGPGYWGITHVLRKLRYREESAAEAPTSAQPS